ncbi:hypothetical protein ACFVWG_28955 [Kribbella sp. NPDC058245]|uniref:hypothetical protein n=1 Tax=Kribbella sp. NPDC058245 TaxID=3346399 RepID=UPI0036F0A20C
MRARLFAATTLAALIIPTTAYAAPAAPTDENLRTTNPATSCIRGVNRPLVNQTSPRLQAFVPAADENDGRSVKVEFRLKNLADGTEVFTSESFTKVVGVWFEAGSEPTLADATTYSWQARVVDSTGAASPWSAGCELSIDTVRPNAPTLTLSPGPYKVGQKITLTFGNAGSTDVTQYAYAVATSAPGSPIPACPGKVTVKLTDSGPTPIRAWSYDRAGNLSPTYTEQRIAVAP